MNPTSKRIIVAVSGASGMIYALNLLKNIPDTYEIHLIISEVARQIIHTEMDDEPYRAEVKKLLNPSSPESAAGKLFLHNEKDFYAPIASGSFITDGMVVIPCSMKTLAGIANGYTNSLIERAADVSLKEKRKLILVVRETPYNRIHLKNMLLADEAGATILPASPGFYNKPQSIDDLANFISRKRFIKDGKRNERKPDGIDWRK